MRMISLKDMAFEYEEDEVVTTFNEFCGLCVGLLNLLKWPNLSSPSQGSVKTLHNSKSIKGKLNISSQFII